MTPSTIPTAGLLPTHSPAQHRFHFLDALRGLAAILVVWRHAPLAYTHALQFPNSYLAVDFFFCLSGFVIAFSYERRLATSLTAGRFALLRLIRLYPLALLGTLLGLAEVVLPSLHGGSLSFIFSARFFTEVALGLVLLPYLSFHHPQALTFVLDGVLWTLFVELLANFVYAALIRLRIVRLRIAGTRSLALLAAASLAVLIVQRNIYGTFDIGSTMDTTPVALTRVGFSFFAGVLVYRAYRRTAPAMLRGRAAGFLAAFLSLAFVFCLCDRSPITQRAFAQFATICVLFPLTVFLGARVDLHAHWTRLCAFLGDISYPIYVLHVPLLWVFTLNPALRFAGGHASLTTPIMLGYTVFLIVAAWLSAQFYDAPIRKLLAAKFRPRTAIAPDQHPHQHSPHRSASPSFPAFASSGDSHEQSK